MDPIYRKHRIQYLKAELELRRITCESLARKFERRPQNHEERSELLNCWEDVSKESYMLQVMLDLLQGEEEEAALNRMNEGASWDSEEFTAFTWFYHSKDKTPAA